MTWFCTSPPFQLNASVVGAGYCEWVGIVIETAAIMIKEKMMRRSRRRTTLTMTMTIMMSSVNFSS